MSEKKGLFSWFGRKSKKADEKLESEQLAAEQLAAEKIEAERLASEKLVADKLAAQKAEAERLASEKLLADKLAAEKAEAERLASEKLLADKLAAQKAEAERLASEKLLADKLAAEKLAKEKAELIRLELEKRALENKGVAQSSSGEGDEYVEVIMFDQDPLDDENLSEEEKAQGFWARFKDSLSKTRLSIGSGLFSLFKDKKIDDDLFEELEEQLIVADIGVDTTMKIIDNLTDHADRKDLKNAEALYKVLKSDLSNMLYDVEQPLNPVAQEVDGQKMPFVILMVGVNGVGKTTTIGKLAKQYQQQGKTVMLAAGDTFRAAAVEQLQVWGDRNDIPVIAQQTGSDSASVLYDAMDAAKARGIDVLIADTAGRLQNKDHLMTELSKIVRIMRKKDATAPHEIMLTIDAGTGQNAISQVNLFNQAVGLTGITLTKLDGTAKGGIIFSIADKFKLPIRYIGTGEGINDLREFKAQEFIDALFAKEDEKSDS